VCRGHAGRPPVRQHEHAGQPTTRQQHERAGQPTTRQHKWDVIGGALEDNGRTARLCVILLVMSVAAVITAVGTLVAMAVVHGWLG
jgi:hypothetical protein